MRNERHNTDINSKRDDLDRANAEEMRQVREEVSQIKKKYIKKYGEPKSQKGIHLSDIAPPTE